MSQNRELLPYKNKQLGCGKRIHRAMPGGDAVSKAKMTTGFWPSGSGGDGKRRTASERALDKQLDLGME